MIILNSKNKNAIIYKDKTFTFNEVLQYSDLYADFFKEKGHTSKILIFAENSPEWIITFYSILRVGAIAIPVDSQCTPHELAYIIDDCQPDCIFTSNEKNATVNAALATTKHKCNTYTTEDIPILENTKITEISVSDMEKTMVIIYTSGTTGSPKGVMLSYKNIFFNVNAVSHDVEIYNEDRNVMILLPLHHILPLLGSVIAPLYVGATVAISENLTADSILSTLKRGEVAIFIGVPRLYEILAKGIMAKINSSAVTRLLYKFAKFVNSKTFSKILFSSVHKKFGGHIEYLVSGGAALPVEIGTIYKVLGFTVLEGYGMTEAAPMITFTRPTNVRVGYAGEPLSGIEVKIDEQGEVCIKGDNIMQGYYNCPEETAHILRDGWLHTGDRGEFDANCLKLTGRIKDIIVTANGKKINPEELEAEVLSQCAFIKEIGIFLKDSVLQCIIVPQMSEIRENTEKDIEATLKDEIAKFNLTVAQYKRIKRIHIYSGELPKTRLMKIQRFKLADLVSQENRKQNAEDKPRSEVYTMLKTFIDAENECNAGENDHIEIDLAMDSLNKVALLTFIESSFGILLNESQLEELNTLGKLSSYIEERETTIQNATNISWKEILSTKLQGVTIPKAGILQTICSRSAQIAMHIVYRYRKSGNAELPNHPCIIVANHRSALDGYFITSKLKGKTVRNTFFFAKEKHLHSKFAHFMASKNNVILMDINKNVRESLQQMAMVLRSGKNIIIFPEGTRSHDEKLLAFKDSFAILSTELNVPVIPVAIKGSERAVFEKIHIPRPFAKISVDFLAPVYPSGEPASALRNNVVSRISNRLYNKF